MSKSCRKRLRSTGNPRSSCCRHHCLCTQRRLPGRSLYNSKILGRRTATLHEASCGSRTALTTRARCGTSFKEDWRNRDAGSKNSRISQSIMQLWVPVRDGDQLQDLAAVRNGLTDLLRHLKYQGHNFRLRQLHLEGGPRFKKIRRCRGHLVHLRQTLRSCAKICERWSLTMNQRGPNCTMAMAAALPVLLTNGDTAPTIMGQIRGISLPRHVRRNAERTGSRISALACELSAGFVGFIKMA
mmetsp:Transcript_134330/g.251379  ORF Transcript_134330/g.251379 Transcript_134330/m.251379 type:complete len:242 (+) Transcript_134330:3255-3980(+)